MTQYEAIVNRRAKGKKAFALLVDPDKLLLEKVPGLVKDAEEAGVDYFFVGGSLMTHDHFESCVSALRASSAVPVLLFPGNGLQISHKAHGILFLSLISGRNPEMLIGHHVVSAPYLRRSPLEVISTGYMLIESGTPTAVSYMSNTTPIPHEKNDIAMCTAMAGEMLGMKAIFLDAGSGAKTPVSVSMIDAVRSSIQVPLIVGGGIRSGAMARQACKAGADIIVVGNACEAEPKLMYEISESVHSS